MPLHLAHIKSDKRRPYFYLTFVILLTMLFSSMTASAQLIYTPYYAATGNITNGKVTWGKYQEVHSSSIFVSREEVKFNLSGATPLILYGYQKVTKGKTGNGQYFYYEGLISSDGVKANMRIDFTNDDWVIISVYMPTLHQHQNCIRAKCKFLCEM